MVSSDTIVGIVGAVILTGAMIAVFYYEAGRDAGPEVPDLGTGSERFTYTYNETTSTVATDPPGGAHGADGAQRNHDFRLPAYATNVHVVLTWTRDMGPGGVLPVFTVPEFEFILLNETGAQVASKSGSASPLDAGGMLTGPGTEPPQDRLVVAANSTAEADALVREHMANQPGQQWTIRVVLNDAGDPTDQGTLSHQYTLAVHVTHWEPQRDAA